MARAPHFPLPDTAEVYDDDTGLIAIPALRCRLGYRKRGGMVSGSGRMEPVTVQALMWQRVTFPTRAYVILNGKRWNVEVGSEAPQNDAFGNERGRTADLIEGDA